MKDKQAIEAVRKRRRKLLINVLEVALGDLVALDGVATTKAVLKKFADQLDNY